MKITTKEEIGRRLYRIRKERGLTQFELASLAEISDRTYTDIERGVTNMHVDTMLKICNILNITPNDILLDEKKAPPAATEEALFEIYQGLSKNDRATAVQLLSVLENRNRND